MPEGNGLIKDEADRLFSGLRRSPARPAIGYQRVTRSDVRRFPR